MSASWRSDLVVLANEAPCAGEAFIGLTNEISAATGDGWARIPYGDHIHDQGIQRFGRAQADKMVGYFKNTWNRLKRAVSGMPVYNGHPDMIDLARERRASLANDAERRALDRQIADLQRRYPDSREYGAVADMEARDDGLYIKPVLTPGGVGLVNEGRSLFSPHWLAETIGTENGRPVFAPIYLFSIGLTDRPNIGGTSLVNESTMNKKLIIQLLAALGRTALANEATDEQINAELTAALPLATALTKRPEATALANEQTARTTAETQLAEAKTQLKTADTALANERTAHAATIKARNEAIVTEAIRTGRIVEAAKPVWLGRLQRDFAVESVALANETSGPKTTPHTAAVGSRKAPIAASEEFTALVNEAMPKHGQNWQKAWGAVSVTAKGRALLEQMETAGKAAAGT